VRDSLVHSLAVNSLGNFQDNYMTVLSSVHDTRDNAARQAKEVRLHLNLF